MPRWEEAPVIEEPKAKPIKAKWESAPVVQDAPQARQDDAGRKEGVGVGQMLRNAGQSITGAVKEVANRATTLAGLTPYGLTLRALGTDKTAGGQSMFDPYFKPSNEAQAVGGMAEKALEFAVPPLRSAGMAGAVATGAQAYGTSLLQGDSQGQAGMAGLIGAASVPGAAFVGKVLAPFAKKVSPTVEAAAARLGVEMPAAARSESKLVPLAEAWSAKGIGGSGTAERYTTANNVLTAMADQTVKRASKLADSSEIGKAIADGLKQFKDQWTRQKASLYAQAALPEKGMKLEAKETIALLDAIIEGKNAAGGILRAGPVADASFYRGLRNGLTKTVEDAQWVGEEYVKSQRRVPRPVEASKLLQAHRELTQKIQSSFADPFSAANKGALKKVSATMERELETAIQAADPALAAKLEVANRAYAEGIQKINSTFGKSIHRLAKDGKYDRIAQSIVNSRVSVDDIPRIMEVAGAEGTEGMRAAVLADLVSKAKGPGGQLYPQGLSRAMKTFGEDRLEALLLPDQMAKMRDIATLSGSLQKGQKVMEGSQTAFLSRPSAEIGYFLASPAKGLAFLIGDVAFSRFVASRVGQRWLTTGYRPLSQGTLATAANVGAQATRIGISQDQ